MIGPYLLSCDVMLSIVCNYMCLTATKWALQKIIEHFCIDIYTLYGKLNSYIIKK